MGTRWISGAERLGDGSIGGDMDTPGLPPRVVWHSTESGNGNAAFNAVRDYLINIGNEPHILYDPVTDRLGQYGPLDKSARALRNDGSNRTNRTGRTCIQIEVLARAKSPFTDYWQPGPNYRALMAAIRSWGIPDRFPMGAPPAYPGGSKRTRAVWLNEAGHFCHANIPGNDHGDPGAISPSRLFATASGGSTPSGKNWIVKTGQTMAAIAAAVGITLSSLIGANPQIKDPDHIEPGQELNLPNEAKPIPANPTNPSTPTKPTPPSPPSDGASSNLGNYQVTINGNTYGPGAYGTHVTKVGQALVTRGFGRYYTVGPGPRWTSADTKAYAAFQRSLGYTGKAADGIPGPVTLRILIGTPTGTTAPYPGRDKVRYQASGPQVLTVDKALIRNGYGRYLSSGPSTYYGKTTRAGVKAFQQNQGWTGTDADGNVGPETWRRITQ
ncbi:peptidoglycan-binding protein [Streptomyces sp. NPDC087850]|uniref:peptidoglycan-binding protein n=1 Tax=Streptomyces sp. NPDC087850 TaxID=3365809 RepID=UPI003814FC02